jgi:hypothetical protein
VAARSCCTGNISHKAVLQQLFSKSATCSRAFCGISRSLGIPGVRRGGCGQRTTSRTYCSVIRRDGRNCLALLFWALATCSAAIAPAAVPVAAADGPVYCTADSTRHSAATRRDRAFEGVYSARVGLVLPRVALLPLVALGVPPVLLLGAVVPAGLYIAAGAAVPPPATAVASCGDSDCCSKGAESCCSLCSTLAVHSADGKDCSQASPGVSTAGTVSSFASTRSAARLQLAGKSGWLAGMLEAHFSRKVQSCVCSVRFCLSCHCCPGCSLYAACFAICCSRYLLCSFQLMMRNPIASISSGPCGNANAPTTSALPSGPMASQNC